MEPAPAPSSSGKRIAIDSLSRVEGHGKVTLLLDDEGRVTQARLHIVEFRGFEKFIEGRPYWEVPVMVERLCGICPVSHHLAAAKAMDMIIGAQIPPTAEKVRRLMHYGQILQIARAAFLLSRLARSAVRLRCRDGATQHRRPRRRSPGDRPPRGADP